MELKIGDQVVITKATNATLNLYQKSKLQGLSYLKCPCNVKTGDVLILETKLKQGFLIRNVTKKWLTIAHPKDLRVVG